MACTQSSCLRCGRGRVAKVVVVEAGGRCVRRARVSQGRWRMCPSGVSRGDDDGQAVVAEFAFLIVHLERLLLLLQRMVY